MKYLSLVRQHAHDWVDAGHGLGPPAEWQAASGYA
jgi:hypothetical protein